MVHEVAIVQEIIVPLEVDNINVCQIKSVNRLNETLRQKSVVAISR